MVGVDLPREIWEEIVAQAQGAMPYEACGLIAGDAAGRPLRYHPMKNVAGRLDWFEPDPMDLLKLTMALEDAGERLWAICHSHPQSPARPSASDIEAAGYPDSLYLICSLLEPDRPVIRAYRIGDGVVSEEVPLRVIAGGCGPASLR